MNGRDLDALFVAHDLAGGGAERVLVNLLRGTAGHGVRARCVLFDAPRVYDVPEGVAVDVLGLPGRSNRRQRILALAERIAHEAPDVIVSFLNGVNLDVALAHRVARSRARLIVTEHNVASRVMSADDARRKRPLMRRLYRRAHRVVCVSTAVRDDLAAHFGIPAERLTVVHNPIDVEATAAAARDSSCARHAWLRDAAARSAPSRDESRSVPTSARPVFVNVASLKERKGHRLLLEAFRTVREKMPCRLLVLGDGPLRPVLEAHAHALGIADDVAFLGFVRDPFPLVAGASALVVASSCEGFPNVVLEAMACGTPVVSTPWPGVSDMIEHDVDGVVATAHDAPSLAHAMDGVARDAELARRLTSAAARTVRRFAIDATVERYLELFTSDGAGGA